MTVLEKDVADYLLKLPKHYIGEVAINFPSVGGRIEYDLFSKDKRERFIMMVLAKGEWRRLWGSLVLEEIPFLLF